MDTHYPTKRPTDAAFRTGEAPEPFPPELTNVPWIDIHNHAHTLSWNEREQFALSGCQGMVMMAAAYYWTPYKPVAPEDVRYLWDDALNRLPQIRRSHVFDAKLGVGIHTGARVEDYEELLDVMPEYCALEEVAAVGEIGITASQHVSAWPLEDQKEVMRRQMEIAADHDLPAVVHTPPDLEDVDIPYRKRGTIPGYELDMSYQQEPVLEAEDVKRAATELDVELAGEAGLAEEQVVLSHADRGIAPYVLEDTDCYLSFTVSYPWLLGVTPRDVAEVVQEYGPERVLVETDSAGILRSDVFSFKRTIFELYRMGLDVDTIRQVVYENPQQVLGA
ncbi:TatD family hydrolase [Halogeometricum luteum]|uniref:TatD family hydrolase n=1 Tax=Halogeometricum luteum TaxID=2950537 RepID=A0ABU2G4G9_9EURY|nr:TatD family hydrolase [Halogeometricum sp. S3BR5-2]MDS0295691.1 TatD family hydrolase [Halogeometricum sp. S3BR5-2]